MTCPPDAGALACALERYLSGDAEAPRRAGFPHAPAALLLTARYGRSVPVLRTADALGEDVRLAGIYRGLALAFDAYSHEVKRDRREAEQTLAVQVSTAFDAVVGWLRESNIVADFSDVFTDEDAYVAGHLRLLAGVLALCAWEVGHEPARVYIRALLPEILGLADGHRYVRVAIGLMEDVDPLHWRPGQGALGRLALALVRGGHLLAEASRGAPQPEPAWATAAREMA
ncbi:hypothetical protein ACFPYM_22025, partial [Methylobacterium hispanicum]